MAFISVEGIEGAGKSTIIKLLADFLQTQKYDLIVTREPGGTPLAESIREVLLHTHPQEKLAAKAELLLMFASRIQHVETLIKPALDSGKWVLCDRFVDASFAYQGGGRQLSAQNLELLTEYSLAGLLPDLTILLDIDVEVAATRLAYRNKDKIEQENNDFFKRVRSAYLTRAKLESKRIKVVDASASVEQVMQSVFKIVQEFIDANRNCSTIMD